MEDSRCIEVLRFLMIDPKSLRKEIIIATAATINAGGSETTASSDKNKAALGELSLFGSIEN